MSPIETLPGIRFVNVKAAMNPVIGQSAKPLKWSEARRAAIQRDGSCRTCSSKDLLTVHHFWPRGTGGGNDLENLVTLCEKCHQNICSTCTRGKHARVPGWAHSEHRIKRMKIHISLREIFEDRSDRPAENGVRTTPWLEPVNATPRKMALPWYFAKEVIMAQENKIPEESV
ncbi:MAG: HNH endonuclease signature motif containing protein [Methanomicrobiales archaeon]